MTQACCLKSPGSLRRSSGGGQKVIKMQGNVNQINNEIETLKSGSSSGNVVALAPGQQNQSRCSVAARECLSS